MSSVWRGWRRGVEPPRATAAPPAEREGEAEGRNDLLGALAVLPFAWVTVDAGLVVQEASAAAMELFEAAPPPQALIAFSRTAEIESHAREAQAGNVGPWEVKARHFDRVLRMHALRLTGGGVVLAWEDITEQRRLEAVRTEFVANLVHELRTPLTSLRLSVETLRAGVEGPERDEFLDRILENTDYVRGLLDTLRQLAELERGSVHLEMEPFELVPLVVETWDRVAHVSDVSLRMAIEPGFSLTADRQKLGQVLQNLLQNAYRFSPQGGEVEVGARPGAGTAEVWVLDHGPGIAPSDLRRVFERFYKADRARVRGEAGSGLGLAIAKHLIEVHRGRIWAESGPGEGTRVAFSIPQPALTDA